MEPRTGLERARDLLARARRPVVFTGAALQRDPDAIVITQNVDGLRERVALRPTPKSSASMASSSKTPAPAREPCSSTWNPVRSTVRSTSPCTAAPPRSSPDCS